MFPGILYTFGPSEYKNIVREKDFFKKNLEKSILSYFPWFSSPDRVLSYPLSLWGRCGFPGTDSGGLSTPKSIFRRKTGYAKTPYLTLGVKTWFGARFVVEITSGRNLDRISRKSVRISQKWIDPQNRGKSRLSSVFRVFPGIGSRGRYGAWFSTFGVENGPSSGKMVIRSKITPKNRSFFSDTPVSHVFFDDFREIVKNRFVSV